MSVSVTCDGPTETVSRWVNGFNTRDVQGMLSCLDPEVHLHPLKFAGLDSSYHGHDGIRRWFTQLCRSRQAYSIELLYVRVVNDGQVIAVGVLNVGEAPGIASFCALHRLDRELILTARHYLTEPDTLKRIGLLR